MVDVDPVVVVVIPFENERGLVEYIRTRGACCDAGECVGCCRAVVGAWERVTRESGEMEKKGWFKEEKWRRRAQRR